MAKDDEGGTPPTGTAIPRPKRVAPGATIYDRVPNEPAPPPAVELNPTLRELYALIDKRLTPEIIERISSVPPPASRPSMGVRAAQATGKWTKWIMAGLGVLTFVGQMIAASLEPQYRGPVVQALKILLAVMDDDPASPPTPVVPDEPEPRAKPAPDAGAP